MTPIKLLFLLPIVAESFVIQPVHVRSTTLSYGLLATNSSVTEASSGNKQSTRWTGSSRWESNADIGEQFLLKEKYGTYFKVPNPATLFTKSICTIGPKTSDPTSIGRMMDAGM